METKDLQKIMTDQDCIDFASYLVEKKYESLWFNEEEKNELKQFFVVEILHARTRYNPDKSTVKFSTFSKFFYLDGITKFIQLFRYKVHVAEHILKNNNETNKEILEQFSDKYINDTEDVKDISKDIEKDYYEIEKVEVFHKIIENCEPKIRDTVKSYIKTGSQEKAAEDLNRSRSFVLDKLKQFKKIGKKRFEEMTV